MQYMKNKKILIFGGLLFLLASIYVIPLALGAHVDPGPTLGEAPLLGPGSHNGILPVGQDNGYYNVSGRTGQTLNVTITSNSTDLARSFFHPNGTQIDFGVSYNFTFSVICDIDAIYYIELNRVGGTDDIHVTIVILFTGGGGGIPGFDLLSILYSISILLGLVLYLNRRKSGI
jgi:hypothetical protein